ncbi:MAG TPA: glycine cleavage system H protein [Abditibacteriaceae bacterium]|jgi:glycine cleavage system H protein
MNTPAHLRYTHNDFWLDVQGEIATIGLTDFAQHELGDIVHLELPTVGARLESGAMLGAVEAVKTVMELRSPVAGEVVESNRALLEDATPINTEPYGTGWLARVKLAADPTELLSAAQYAAMHP